MQPHDLTATEAAAAISAGSLTAEALARSCLEKAAALEPAVHAFAYLNPDQVLDVARSLDQGSATGALHGVPFVAKDIIDSHDMPTGYGSPIYKGAQPFADASPIAMARAAGGLLMGKTVTTEFANLSPNETANPLIQRARRAGLPLGLRLRSRRVWHHWLMARKPRNRRSGPPRSAASTAIARPRAISACRACGRLQAHSTGWASSPEALTISPSSAPSCCEHRCRS